MLFFLALAKARAQCRYPCHLDQASNVGQRQKERNPWGARQKGRLAASLARCSPIAGMRLARSLPSAPSASTRDPLQFFNSLLERSDKLRHPLPRLLIWQPAEASRHVVLQVPDVAGRGNRTGDGSVAQNPFEKKLRPRFEIELPCPVGQQPGPAPVFTADQAAEYGLIDRVIREH